MCSALQGQPFVYMFANCSVLLEINIYYKFLCTFDMTSPGTLVCAKAKYFIKGIIVTKLNVHFQNMRYFTLGACKLKLHKLNFSQNIILNR